MLWNIFIFNIKRNLNSKHFFISVCICVFKSNVVYSLLGYIYGLFYNLNFSGIFFYN